MFYHFLYPLKDTFFFFNVFRYITFRAMGASVTAFLFSIVLFPYVIRWLSRLSVVNFAQREHAEKIHSFYSSKEKVPTMGGILIVISIVLANLLWGDLTNSYLLISLFVLIWFGLVGFVDDYLKLTTGSSRGLPGKIVSLLLRCRHRQLVANKSDHVVIPFGSVLCIQRCE